MSSWAGVRACFRSFSRIGTRTPTRRLTQQTCGRLNSALFKRQQRSLLLTQIGAPLAIGSVKNLQFINQSTQLI
jgi:hypothetical protein